MYTPTGQLPPPALRRRRRFPPCLVCGERAVHAHHVISKHRLRKVARARRYTDGELRRLLNEPVNTVPLCFGCHRIRHHSRHAIECRILPDEAIRFGFDALGAAAYDYFHYAGDDPRLEEALRRHRLTAP
jgi:hypothetical protein